MAVAKHADQVEAGRADDVERFEQELREANRAIEAAQAKLIAAIRLSSQDDLNS